MAPACGREAEIRKTHCTEAKSMQYSVCLPCVGENILKVACVPIPCVCQPNYFVCGEPLHIIVCVCAAAHFVCGEPLQEYCVCVQWLALCAESCCRPCAVACYIL